MLPWYHWPGPVRGWDGISMCFLQVARESMPLKIFEVFVFDCTIVYEFLVPSHTDSIAYPLRSSSANPGPERAKQQPLQDTQSERVFQLVFFERSWKWNALHRRSRSYFDHKSVRSPNRYFLECWIHLSLSGCWTNLKSLQCDIMYVFLLYAVPQVIGALQRINYSERHTQALILAPTRELANQKLAKIWCKWMRQDATRLDKIMKRQCVKMCQELSIVTMDSRCIRCSSMCEEWPDIRCDRDWENMHDAWCRFEELALRSQNARYLKFKKAATCSHSRPQVAASGRKWPHVAARGPVGFEISKAASLASFAATLAATCSHSSGRKWPLGQVAARGRTWPVALLVGFEISRAASLAAICIICSHLQPLAATCSHLQPLEWPQVAASGRMWLLGRQIPTRMAPPLKTWKKNYAFLANCIFWSFVCETWGESWNERKEITNRREELKRKDGRNEMDKVKGKEELNEQDRRADTKAQTQRIERKSWNGRKNWTTRT